MNFMMASERDERKRQLLQWISPETPWESHRAALKAHQPGTGEWLPQSAEFLKWKPGCYQICWLSGPRKYQPTILMLSPGKESEISLVDMCVARKAGSGKSILLYVLPSTRTPWLIRAF